ncbi:WG repeat-containing protein [Clostridium formicaceticum]|uniref:Anti-sigma-V factor RsiV n=1 Tax=Clostridium formicaceticum TaxID=1497 RepID=A0AAC9RN04_9CLOT|nr:WG repeat-containing protein [Clostridium formicaceticum]AOY77960.1 hypothetical protein BJL90_20085 [Clostridium formicaceticum]ARE88582.1 Anti-sigma-V factor RsiV [Clostridium formicaceticum]
MFLDPKELRGSGRFLDVGLYPAAITEVGGTRWGYIDRSGKFFIPPIFDMVEEFQENGLAIVTKDGFSGIIDVTGAYIVEPKYYNISAYSEGRAVVWETGRSKMIDEKGKVLFQTEGSIGAMRENRAWFNQNIDDVSWLGGYVDREGKVIVPPQYSSTGDFKCGKAVVERKDSQGYAIINLDGKILNTFNYAFVGDLGNGLLPFKESMEGKFGFIDEKGKVIIPPQFEGAQPFENCRAVVVNYKDYWPYYGLIDTRGKQVIPLRYNEVKFIGEGRVAVCIPISKKNSFAGSRCAIADLNGKLVTDFLYTYVTTYNRGYLSVSDGVTTFFIDKYGRKAIELPMVEGEGTFSFINSLIKVNIDNRIAYLDLTGTVIWKQSKDVVLNHQYVVRSIKYKPRRDYIVYYPQIEGMKDYEIQRKVNKRLKEMSLSKGIDGEDFEYAYDSDFTVTFFKKDLVVIEISGYLYPYGAAHGMPSRIYAHVDLKTGRFYQLEDLFKKDSDYVKVLSDIIRQQIIQQGEDSSVWLDEYKGIRPDQPFFVTEDALNIYFLPYEIAPYAAGFPTFTIPFKEIMSLIDTKGAFWQSFH